MKLSWSKFTLQFKRPSGTSRGILNTKDSYFLFFEEEGKISGIGECGLLRGLSVDDVPGYEIQLDALCEAFKYGKELESILYSFPSIRFGWEMVQKDRNTGGKNLLFPSPFTEGLEKQSINGLIWMGDYDFMSKELGERLEKGFNCIKMKIGAINFDEELALVKKIRKEYKAEEIEIRVDANGAFHPDTALEKLKRLSDLQLHSIEQPIRQGQWDEMAILCAKTPLPIALDEELIGVFKEEEKQQLLQTIRPQYIILKPSLIGGWEASEQWISLAKKYDADWWVTSALESNIGLNAIAQWTFTLGNKMPQGLGTGSLYTNNFPSPLYVEDGAIGYDPDKNWDLANLLDSIQTS